MSYIPAVNINYTATCSDTKVGHFIKQVVLHKRHPKGPFKKGQPLSKMTQQCDSAHTKTTESYLNMNVFDFKSLKNGYTFVSQLVLLKISI